ncbi:MAG TPA: hypothetical protein VKQ06_00380, partial [Gammaproteobacteria bacterium]|nr:hypothetical protein [Gammaproteobacteria bacterium]
MLAASIRRSIGKWQLCAAAIGALLVSFVLVSGPSAQSVDTAVSVPAIEGPVSFADVIAAVNPAVVNISVQKLSRTSFSGLRGPGGQTPEAMPFGEFFGRFFD